MNNDITIFGETSFRNERRRFGIKRTDRQRHMYVIGKTGMGKSVLLENMIYSDIMNGQGLCMVDPHGDSAELIVDCVPKERINDVIYFNPADLENPIAFNVLEKVDSRYRHLVASGLVGVFKKIWADSWGPRLEYILRNTILALLDHPESTLLGVNRMLVDKEYRKKVLSKVQDPVVKMFWQDEFTKYNDKFLTEAIAPIQNKIGQFLSTSLIRNIVGQVKSTIDLRGIMDDGKILILNLSKGRIGEDASALLGAMMITKIQLAAMSRVDVPESERRDFYLYVDEFQNFATESFANILSEARKYHLCLTVAHQYIGQLEIGGNTVVRDAIFGNVGTMVSFRVGAGDAEFLVKEYAPKFEEEDLVNLPKYNVYLKLMIDGVASDPFSAFTLPPISRKTGSEATVLKVSREKYAKPRDVVEEKIARWHGVETEAMLEKLEKELEQKKSKAVYNKKVNFLGADEEPATSDGEEKELREKLAKKREHLEEKPDIKEEDINIVNCDGCGVKTKINFKPDPSRPVFCKDCLKEYRRGQSLKENSEKRRKAVEEAVEKSRSKSRRNAPPRKAPNLSRPERKSPDQLANPLKPSGRKVSVTNEQGEELSLNDLKARLRKQAE